MNMDRLQGKWKQICGSVEEWWGCLTDDRSSVLMGKRDRLAGRVQERYGINKEASGRQLREFLHRNRN